MWQCSQQHENRENSKFCSRCGEKRVVPFYCSQCGSLLEPEDVFCTSCGQRRDAEPEVAAAPSAAVEVPVAKPPAPVAPEVPAPAPGVAPPEEPVTFSFGGAKIAMGNDPRKPPNVVAAPAGSAQPVRRGRLTPTQSAILGFVVSAAVLGLAFYLVNH